MPTANSSEMRKSSKAEVALDAFSGYTLGDYSERSLAKVERCDGKERCTRTVGQLTKSSYRHDRKTKIELRWSCCSARSF